MPSKQPYWTRWLATLALLAGLIVASSGAAAAIPAADVDGNTYTSPQFGFTVTWDDTWFVVGEGSDQIDSLDLTNGTTFGTFVAGNEFSGNAQLAVTTSATFLERDSSVSDFTEMKGLDGDAIGGGDDARSFAAYSLAITTADGTTLEMVAYIEARTLVPDESVLIFNAFSPVDSFFDEWPAIQKLLEGVSIGIGPGPGTDTTDGPDLPGFPNAQTTPDPDEETAPADGEPGPAFVSGPWRVAVRVAALNDTLESVGLEPEDGQEWLVVLADVTNWSEDDGEFDASEFTVQVDGHGATIETAEDKTGSVASVLGVGPDEDSLRLEIPAGETERVVLVYSIPERSRGIVLQREDTALPLADALAVSIDPEALPAPVSPPEVQVGELVSASDGKTVRVQIAGKSRSTRIVLLGVQPPANGDCFDQEAENWLDELPGQEILIEEDGAVTGDSGTVRYLWLVNNDGTRTLINHRLIADGLATTASLPFDARFGAWLLKAEQGAKAESIGLWNGCAGEADAPATSPTAEATADAAPAAPTRPAPKPAPENGTKASPTPDD